MEYDGDKGPWSKAAWREFGDESSSGQLIGMLNSCPGEYDAERGNNVDAEKRQSRDLTSRPRGGLRMRLFASLLFVFLLSIASGTTLMWIQQSASLVVSVHAVHEQTMAGMLENTVAQGDEHLSATTHLLVIKKPGDTASSRLQRTLRSDRESPRNNSVPGAQEGMSGADATRRQAKEDVRQGQEDPESQHLVTVKVIAGPDSVNLDKLEESKIAASPRYVTADLNELHAVRAALSEGSVVNNEPDGVGEKSSSVTGASLETRVRHVLNEVREPPSKSVLLRPQPTAGIGVGLAKSFRRSLGSENVVADPVKAETRAAKSQGFAGLSSPTGAMRKRAACAHRALKFTKRSCGYKSGLRMLGDKVYGGWKMCVEGIHEMAKEQREALVVYGFGVGFDTSWDEALMSQYGLNVHAFDPTPRSLEYVRGRKELQTPLFHHSAVGLGTTNRNETWYEPRKGRWEASNSKYNHLKDGIAHEVEVKTLKTLMQERGHTHIDVLKIDIEGAEYEVLVDLLKDGGCLPTNQLLMETHSYQMKQLWKAHGETVALLEQAGFRLVFAGPGNHEHTWIQMVVLTYNVKRAFGKPYILSRRFVEPVNDAMGSPTSICKWIVVLQSWNLPAIEREIASTFPECFLGPCKASASDRECLPPRVSCSASTPLL
ncbi:Methyltransferase-like protein 24 [Porphyridium purpureum]|uniref:Methyltransferase-like protein 24 n=1 Tax=Porphyridium purpureum TaxID=35688 RepID=A0A5J4YRU2_PORPP|nr:Methyltransferase-like protein 24 [Porphyridium purpureum]|eukprot:POR3595..scf236_6